MAWVVIRELIDNNLESFEMILVCVFKVFFFFFGFKNVARHVHIQSRGEGLKSNQKMLGYSYNIQATVVPVGVSPHVICIIASCVQSWLRLIITFLLCQPLSAL